jgi:preprotein translocase subunit YajC
VVWLIGYYSDEEVVEMGGEGGDLTFFIVVILGLGVFLFLPQFMSRRRQKQREASLKVGDRVVTVGGLIGEITYLNFEANLARIKVAEGVELSILPGGIGGQHSEPGRAGDGDRT